MSLEWIVKEWCVRVLCGFK